MTAPDEELELLELELLELEEVLGLFDPELLELELLELEPFDV